MHLVYIDDSKDLNLLCFSAILIPAGSWHEALDHLIGARRHMRESDGIYSSVELHATDWLGGRGNVAPHVVPKGARVRLFDFFLSSVVRLPGVQVINACDRRNLEMTLFERLLNRINVNMGRAGSHAMIISDEGKSYDKLLRKMRRHNYIASRYGAWPDGSPARNIPVSRIIEDISYRDSARSLFVQAADFAAYSLLRFEAPTKNAAKYGFDKSFLTLDPVLVKRAFAADPKRLGIIRGT